MTVLNDLISVSLKEKSMGFNDVINIGIGYPNPDEFVIPHRISDKPIHRGS